MTYEYWLEPPEEPEPPECSNCEEGFGEYLYDGKNDRGEPVQVFCCDHCGYQWSWLIDPEPGPPPDIPDYDADEVSRLSPSQCPHGEPWGECSACDHAGDLAYDAARERRVFGR